MTGSLRVLAGTALLGSAAIGGVLFAFSGFVMPALRRLPGAQGAAAMQSINVTAQRPPLMVLLFATTAACLAVAVVAVRRWGQPGSALLVAGSVTFLIGGLLLTAVVNVPMNDRLAALDPAVAAANGRWDDYLRWWTLANHVRTVACLVAAGLLLTATTAGSS